MRGARFELAELRAKAVALRNEGRSITDRPTFDEWEKQTLDWNDKVIDAIKKLNDADAMLFSVLDVVYEARLPIERSSSVDPMLDDAHFKAYREHDHRLMRLGEMLYKLWER